MVLQKQYFIKIALQNSGIITFYLFVGKQAKHSGVHSFQPFQQNHGARDFIMLCAADRQQHIGGFGGFVYIQCISNIIMIKFTGVVTIYTIVLFLQLSFLRMRSSLSRRITNSVTVQKKAEHSLGGMIYF